MQPRFFLAITPRGAGLSAALFYRVAGSDVQGWFTGARDHGRESRFFVLERYFHDEPTVLWRSAEGDARGRWIADGTARARDVHSPMPEAACLELERLQSAFAAEWLFYADDPRAAPEIDAYRRLELPVGTVNVRSSQFARFDRGGPTWTYASPDTDLNVVLHLARRWTLDWRGTPVPA